MSKWRLKVRLKAILNVSITIARLKLSKVGQNTGERIRCCGLRACCSRRYF